MENVVLGLGERLGKPLSCSTILRGCFGKLKKMRLTAKDVCEDCDSAQWGIFFIFPFVFLLGYELIGQCHSSVG